MRPTAGVALLLVPAVLLAGDETLPSPRPAPAARMPVGEETLPPPRPAPGPRPFSWPPPAPPRLPNLPPVPETPSAAADLAALRQEADRLRAEREALAVERQRAEEEVPADSDEVARLRRRLAELVAKLSAGPPPRRAPAVEADLPPPTRPGAAARSPAPAAAGSAAAPPSSEALPGDPLLAARALFRAGDHAGALETYRQIDLNGLTRDERALVQYMCACCLRKLGRLDEAAALYREVASAREDEALTDCALWHISALNWRRDMEKQLEELRQRRQAR